MSVPETAECTDVVTQSFAEVGVGWAKPGTWSIRAVSQMGGAHALG